jgi:MurNAc alpha-1-phosphate uridylyltransferase
MKAMILAAGYGTRLKPITNNIPKALVEVNNITLLENAINTITKFGFEDVVINIHHFAEKMKNFINKNTFPAKISISDESKRSLDIGGGLKNVSWFFDNEPFLLFNVDVVSDINLSKMMEFHKSSEALVTLACRKRKSSRYLLFDEDNKLVGWRNDKNGEEKLVRESDTSFKQTAFSGIHIIEPKIFELMPKKNKFSIIELYLNLANDYWLQSYDHSDSQWIDAGKKQGLIQAREIIN